jgi:hypothetical protein
VFPRAYRPHATRNDNAELAKAGSAVFVCARGAGAPTEPVSQLVGVATASNRWNVIESGLTSNVKAPSFFATPSRSGS